MSVQKKFAITGRDDSMGASPSLPSLAADRRGASVVEVLIALIVLSFGMLGMAGTTAMVVRQTTMADLSSKRAAAVQTVAERLRALPFDSIGYGSDTIGMYAVSWQSQPDGPRSKDIRIVTTGPGQNSGNGGGLGGQVSDTVEVKVLMR